MSFEGLVDHLGLITAKEIQLLANIQRKYSAAILQPVRLWETEVEREQRKVINAVNKCGDPDEPIWISDISTIVAQMAKWRAHLPQIKPHYAVKCSSSPVLLDILIALGSHFDCASKAEIKQMMDLGVPAEHIVLSNPCKQLSHIIAAREAGIGTTVIDNEFELDKLAQEWPNVKILIRLKTDDAGSTCRFSTKFGAPMEIVPRLIRKIVQLKLKLTGVSFHVGSGCGDTSSYEKALLDARKVFDLATKEGFTMDTLDIGGGFPGDEHATPTFEDIAAAAWPTIEKLFPNVVVIAEPGRYFAAASHTLAAKIHSKRYTADDQEEDADDTKATGKEYGGVPVESDRSCRSGSVADESEDEPQAYPNVQYYLNDGTYQSFNCIFFDHAVVRPYPLPIKLINITPTQTIRLTSVHGANYSVPKKSTFFGPTCDSLDCIARNVLFPELNIGDWVYFANMGAYTSAAASAFNGFHEWNSYCCTAVDFIAMSMSLGEHATEPTLDTQQKNAKKASELIRKLTRFVTPTRYLKVQH